MRAIVEWDGVLSDVRAAYWHAYSEAVAAIDFARTDEATFWRLTRRGADAGQFILGAKPRHIEAYQQHFAATLESDETVARMAPNEGALERIREACKRVAIVTTGANVAARRNVAAEATSNTSESSSESFEMAHFVPPLAAALRACADEFGPGSPVIALAGTEELIRAADEAELLPIGIASGACGAKRLATRGARATFAALDAFLDARQTGDPQLAALGINPPPTPTIDRPRPNIGREAAREARRQARMARRNRG